MTKTKIIYTICAAALCIAAMLGVYATAVSTNADEAETISLIVESESLERYYDGTPLKSGKNGANIISGNLQDGDSIFFEFSASQTNVGSTDNIVTAKILNGEGIDVTPKYSIEYRNGKLKVNQRQLSIATDSASKIYDGIPLECDGYEIVSGEIAKNQQLFVTGGAEITNVGKTTNLLTFNVFDNANNDVTSNYNISISAGDVEVKQCPITIKSADSRKTYDGQVLKNEECNVISGNLVDRFCVVSGSDYASITKAGIIENTFTAVIVNGDGEDITDNYDITYNYGTLTIDKAPITITSIDLSREYNGQPLTVPTENNYLLDGEIVEGQILDVKFPNENAITNVGTKANEFTFQIRDKGVDVTSNYDVTSIYGTLNIEPIKLTLRTKNVFASKKIFDGTPLTNNEVVVLEDSDIISIGELNALDSSLPITFVGSSREEKLYVRANGSLTDVGTIKNTFIALITFTKEDSNLDDVTSNYEFINELTDLTVTKKKITIEAGSATKPFDGEPLVKLDGARAYDSETGEDIDCISLSEISQLPTMSVTNFVVSGEGIGSQTTIGTSENGFNYVNASNVACVFCKGTGSIPTPIENVNNYEITIIPGKLTVTKCKLVIRSESVSKNYDGNVFDSETVLTSSTDFNVVAVDEINNVGGFVNIPENYKLVPQYFGDCVTMSLPGTSRITFVVDIIDTKGTIDTVDDVTVTENYDVAYEYGDATINKISLQIISKTLTKAYDGIEFDSEAFSIDKPTEIPSDFDFETTFSEDAQNLVNVGSVQNFFTAKITNNGEDVSNYFNVAYVYGTLSITKADVEILSNDLNKIYDGYAFASSEFSFIDNGLVGSDEITVSYANKNVINAGEYKNEFTYTLTNENNYNVKVIYGTIIIEKAEINVESNDQSKIYDGKTFALNELEVSVYGELSFEDEVKVTFIDYQSLVNVGSVDNSFDVKVYCGSVDVSANYNVYKYYGLLSIDKADITITSNSLSKIYDGKPFNVSDLNVVAVGDWFYGDTITPSFTSFETFDYVGTIYNDFSVVVKNEDNYNVDFDYGELTIEKANLTLTSNSLTKTYDGNTFVLSDFKVTPIGLVDPTDLLYVDFTNADLFECGSKENSFTFMLANDENYNVSTNFGIITINKANVTIVSNSLSKTYDGNTFDNMDFDFVAFGLVGSDIVSNIMFDNELTIDAGSYLNTFTCDVAGGDNYNVSYSYGLITINKANATIVSNSLSKTYDGYAFDSFDFDFTATGFVGSDGVSNIEFFNEATSDAGTYLNAFSYELVGGDNYNVSVNFGTLTINRKNIFVFTPSGSYSKTSLLDSAYIDGSVLGDSVVTGLVGGDQLTVECNGIQLDVGTSYNTVESFTFDVGNENNYNINLICGMLTINEFVA